MRYKITSILLLMARSCSPYSKRSEDKRMRKPSLTPPFISDVRLVKTIILSSWLHFISLVHQWRKQKLNDREREREGERKWRRGEGREQESKGGRNREREDEGKRVWSDHPLITHGGYLIMPNSNDPAPWLLGTDFWHRVHSSGTPPSSSGLL